MGKVYAVVEVNGGVAEQTWGGPFVEVIVIDHDNLKEDTEISPMEYTDFADEIDGDEREGGNPVLAQYIRDVVKPYIKRRLEQFRQSIHDENISYGEITDLQGLVPYIDPSDTELLEWAGVSEEDYRRGLGIN